MVTPKGVCDILASHSLKHEMANNTFRKIFENHEILKIQNLFSNIKRQNSVIRIKIALNTSDSPFGWRGKNKGATVFFSDDTHFMHENHELKLNANNEVHFQLRVRNGSVSVSWDSFFDQGP